MRGVKTECKWKEASQTVHRGQSYTGSGPGEGRTLSPCSGGSRVSGEGLRGLTGLSTVEEKPGSWIEGGLENSVPRGIIYTHIHLCLISCNIVPTPWPL